MTFIRGLLGALGLLGVLVGMIWIGQGSGYFPYPASSFMINDKAWIYWGLAVAAIGAALVAICRKL